LFVFFFVLSFFFCRFFFASEFVLMLLFFSLHSSADSRLKRIADWISSWNWLTNTGPAASPAQEQSCIAQLRRKGVISEPIRVSSLLSQVERRPWCYIYFTVVCWLFLGITLF
jgi:hypothetical protein